MTEHSAITLVIPCYNEAARLDLDAFTHALAALPALRFCFVDDGSSDATASLLATVQASAPQRVDILRLPANVGKAEAVRQGLLRVCGNDVTASRHALTGFWDADLSARLDELPAFLNILAQQPDVEWVWGIRLRSLGRSVRRSALRHYLGRGFATATSLALDLGTYDTQCGAKVFRVTPLLAEVVSVPFLSRWVFDVEMLSRADQLLQASRACRVDQVVYEHPLRRWHHQHGSKIGGVDFVRALIGLLQIRSGAAQWRRRLPALSR
jgi:dolichyl-phosphate beta-glucosyltransferase